MNFWSHMSVACVKNWLHFAQSTIDVTVSSLH